MQIEQALDRYVVQLEADGRSPHTITLVRRHASIASTIIYATVSREQLRAATVG